MTNEIQTTNGINSALAQIMSQETPKEAIRTRPGKGGRVLLYTDGAYVIRTLNEAFAFHWDFEVDHEEILYVGERPFEARCRGKLVIRAGDITITKMQFGCQPIETIKDKDIPVSLGDAYKGAATDALKKCASLLGIALDLYDSDSEVNTANPQQVQREIQQAKQQAKAPVIVTPISTMPHVTTFIDEQSIKPIEAIEQQLDVLVKEVTGDIPTTPQKLTDAVNAALGQKYYNAPSHVYNALGKVPWPKPDDKSSWADVYAAALDYARQRIAEKVA